MNLISSTPFAFALLFATAASAEISPSKSAVLRNYADIAETKYDDSLTAAETLQAAVKKRTQYPSAVMLFAAREAWVAARVRCLRIWTPRLREALPALR